MDDIFINESNKNIPFNKNPSQKQSKYLIFLIILLTKISLSFSSVVQFNTNSDPFSKEEKKIKKIDLNYKYHDTKITYSPYGSILSEDLMNNSNQALMEILPETNDLGFFIKLNIGNPEFQTTLFLDFFNYYSYVFTSDMKNPSFNLCWDEFKFFMTGESSTYLIDSNKHFTSKIFVRDFNLTGQSGMDTLVFYLDNGELIEMENFSFYAIQNAELKYNSSLCFGGSQYFGGIGMGFTNLQGYGFLDQMKNRNLIENKMFAILLPLQAEKPLLHLGGYKKEFVNDTNDINWIDVKFPEDNDKKLKYLINDKERENSLNDLILKEDLNNTNRINWFIEVSKFYMNDITFDESAKIFVDSLSPYITVPKSFFFNNFKNFFSNETDCKMEQDGFFYCKCHPDINKDYPKFSFNFNDKYNLTVNPRDYLEVIINYNTDDVRACRLLMKLNYDNDFWGIGKFVMNNFYMIFDQENNKLGFYDRSKINQINSDKALIMIMIVSCASFVILAILYCCIRKIIERRNSGSNNQALLGI